MVLGKSLLTRGSHGVRLRQSLSSKQALSKRPARKIIRCFSHLKLMIQAAVCPEYNIGIEFSSCLVKEGIQVVNRFIYVCFLYHVPGIDPNKWESVFESFEQADPSTTRL